MATVALLQKSTPHKSLEHVEDALAGIARSGLALSAWVDVTELRVVAIYPLNPALSVADLNNAPKLQHGQRYVLLD
ncbi:hypothetical protein ACYCFK_09445 [Stutzerimonas stutzeri]